MFLFLDNDYVWEPHFKKLNSSYLAIPGLHMFGKADFKRAIIPLEEHSHPDCYEFVAVLSGTQSYSIGSEIFPLTGGDVFMTSPGEIHGSGKAPQQMAHFLWFQINISDPDSFLGLSAPFALSLAQRIANYRLRICKVSSSDLELLSRSFSCFAAKGAESHRLGHSLFLSFLSALLLAPDIQRVLNYIENNLSADLDFFTLAHVGNLSVSRLKTKFKEQLRTTPREYINRLCIEQAKNLLLHSSRSVTEIAFELNFSSSSYFSSVFKQFTGYTPTDYLKNASSDHGNGCRFND